MKSKQTTLGNRRVPSHARSHINRFWTASAFALLSTGNAACTSSREVKNIDTKIDVKGATPNEAIGVNQDGEAVVQKESSAGSRLVTLEHVNENLKLDLKQEFFLLRECRETLALSETGGSGEYPELSDFDNLEVQFEKKTKLGLEDGQLKIVETSDLQERISAQESFQKELTTFIRTVKREKEKCDFALREREGTRAMSKP